MSTDAVETYLAGLDEPLPSALIATLIDARLAELGLSRGDDGAVG